MSYGLEYGRGGNDFSGFGGADPMGGGGGFQADGGHGAGGAGASPEARRGGISNIIIPVTIKMLIEAQFDEAIGVYIINGQPVRQVKFTAVIAAVSDNQSYRHYFVEDSTAGIYVETLVDDPGAMSQRQRERIESLREGALVSVAAQLRHEETGVTLSAFSVRPIVDANEVTHHMLDVIYTHLQMTRPKAPVGAAGVLPAGQSLAVGMTGGGGYKPQLQAGGQGGAGGGGGVSKVEEIICDVIRQHGVGEDGLHVDVIIKYVAQRISLPNVADSVNKAIDKMTGEGAVYSSIDDFHWRVTE